MRDYIYIVAITCVFTVFILLFNFFPRSEYSHLENRKLKSFPNFSVESLKSGEFTNEISAWYSDTEPYRDVFMLLNMEFNDAIKSKIGDRVTYHASETENLDIDEGGDEVIHNFATNDSIIVTQQKIDTLDATEVEKMKKQYANEEKANITNSGILIVGSGENIRALMGFYAKEKSGLSFARVVNKYRAAFADSIRIYCMPIPIASAYYLPKSVKNKVSEQWPVFNRIFKALDEDVEIVNVYTILGQHIDEPIYLRTDHHWAPLGGYYAAMKFAEVAGVPYPKLADYQERVVRDYVGSMYGYSQDIALKKAPENFYYYVPQGVEYTTTYIDYTLDEEYNIIGESKPFKDKFFHHYKDGNGGAYCTFMGADMRITKVETSTESSRKLLILKDSYGNTIPGFLFHSFKEIHVIDYRYFNKNIKKYVNDNGITDILFANNIQHCCTASLPRAYNSFLTDY